MRALFSILFCLFLLQTVSAQSTEFVYQGSLKDGANPAIGNYDFEFRLFDAVSGGAQVGPLLTRSNIAVSGGIFSVSLDFGSVFPGADRYLEIRARNSGAGSFTILAPRQKLASAPYAVKSLTAENALQLGGLAASQYVQTNDSRLSDARNPLPGNTNYIQNTGAPQASSNFNISGNGTAGGTLSGNAVNASTQYNLGNSRILDAGGIFSTSIGIGAGAPGTDNTYVGANAGAVTIGSDNSFFGSRAGSSNSGGAFNSFFGSLAGRNNVGASFNSFFGANAGTNSTGSRNSFFGNSAGITNLTGNDNSFFGNTAGASNAAGDANAYFGSEAGDSMNGSFNSLFGMEAGTNYTSGGDNAHFGFGAGAGIQTGTGNSSFGSLSRNGNGLSNSTSIGFRAMVTQSNALVLGAINGINGATFDTSVGIGTTAPERKLHVAGPASVEIQIESTDIGGRKWTLQSSSAANGGRFEIIDRTANASRMTILDDGSVGVGTVAPADKLHVNGIVRINTLGAAGATHLCRNASNQISTCSSPRSYGNGDVESIEYERMFNILKEQQEKLESQQKELESQRSVIVQQRSELDGLKAHLCQQTPSAAFCPGSGQK